MNEISVRELIVSQQIRRGNGIEGDPVRAITTVHEKDGTLIAENDPYGMFTATDAVLFCKWFDANGKGDPKLSDFELWLNRNGSIKNFETTT